MYQYDNTLDGKKFEIVGEIGDGGGYDWFDGMVLRDEDGNLWWRSAGGCSCNSFWDDVTSWSDFTLCKNLQEAVEFAKADGFSDIEVANFASDILF